MDSRYPEYFKFQIKLIYFIIKLFTNKINFYLLFSIHTTYTYQSLLDLKLGTRGGRKNTRKTRKNKKHKKDDKLKKTKKYYKRINKNKTKRRIKKFKHVNSRRN